MLVIRRQDGLALLVERVEQLGLGLEVVVLAAVEVQVVGSQVQERRHTKPGTFHSR